MQFPYMFRFVEQCDEDSYWPFMRCYFHCTTEMSLQVETNLFFHFTKISPVVCVSERRGGGYIIYSTRDYCMVVSFVINMRHEVSGRADL